MRSFAYVIDMPENVKIRVRSDALKHSLKIYEEALLHGFAVPIFLHIRIVSVSVVD